MATLTTTASLTTAASPQKWRVSWNAKFYDYEGRLQAAQKFMQFRIFWQSWGNRSLKSISKVRKKRHRIYYLSRLLPG